MLKDDEQRADEIIPAFTMQETLAAKGLSCALRELP
jgi:hypothetical protein